VTLIPHASQDLTLRGIRWLLAIRPSPCQIVLTETGASTGHKAWKAEALNVERADVIGFTARGSWLLEVKVSRADFMRDRSKPHRSDGNGMGTHRLFVAPVGTIKPVELPSNWGLLEPRGRGLTLVTFPGKFELSREAILKELRLLVRFAAWRTDDDRKRYEPISASCSHWRALTLSDSDDGASCPDCGQTFRISHQVKEPVVFEDWHENSITG